MDRNLPKGFTLLEVMFALIFIAITMGAVIESGANSTLRSSHLKEKTIASWVAQNRLALYRAKKTWSNVSNKSGVVDMAGVQWRWKMKISKTDEPLMRRIDIDVYLGDSDEISASETGFIAKL
ncbi:MAG: type II secretion system minor pseudopilin GspI [Gammaproteobacteria bacterium]